MNILTKLKDTAISVLPVMAIVCLLGFTVVPVEKILLFRFIVGGLLLIIGLTVFLLGVDLGIQPVGERCGAELTKKRNLALLLVAAFIIGFIVYHLSITFPGCKDFVLMTKSEIKSCFPILS